MGHIPAVDTLAAKILAVYILLAVDIPLAVDILDILLASGILVVDILAVEHKDS